MIRNKTPIAVLGMVMMVSACAVKDLKAPCSDKSVPSLNAYGPSPRIVQNGAFLTLDGDDCGPLKPLNRREASSYGTD
jgi:hypothetical protein